MGDLGVHGIIILKLVLKEQSVNVIPEKVILS
jgi:hypothetical protein